MSRIILSALLYNFLFLTSALAFSDSGTPRIDSTFVLLYDITSNGKEDSLIIKITGDTWQTPFTTEYTIISNGNPILSESSYDDAIDQDFGDANMIDWCKGYVACKKEWYFTRLPKEAVVVIPAKSTNKKQLLDINSDMSIPVLAQQFYRDSLGFSNKKAQQEALKLARMLKAMDITLIILPVLPVHRSFPRIYDPNHNIFIQLFGY